MQSISVSRNLRSKGCGSYFRYAFRLSSSQNRSTHKSTSYGAGRGISVAQIRPLDRWKSNAFWNILDYPVSVRFPVGLFGGCERNFEFEAKYSKKKMEMWTLLTATLRLMRKNLWAKHKHRRQQPKRPSWGPFENVFFFFYFLGYCHHNNYRSFTV